MARTRVIVSRVTEPPFHNNSWKIFILSPMQSRYRTKNFYSGLEGFLFTYDLRYLQLLGKVVLGIGVVLVRLCEEFSWQDRLSREVLQHKVGRLCHNQAQRKVTHSIYFLETNVAETYICMFYKYTCWITWILVDKVLKQVLYWEYWRAGTCFLQKRSRFPIDVEMIAS